VVALEFSPGKPEPTPLQVVMQNTVDAEQQTLEVLCDAAIEKAVAEACVEGQDDAEERKQQVSDFVAQKVQQMQQEAETKAEEMAEKLQTEIAKDMVEIETKGRKIVIRIQEKGAFASGSAILESDFLPILDKLITILGTVEGNITVEGHTDNVPINTVMFPSNWDLSVARALEVAHALFDGGELEENRFTISGYADTRPLAANNSPENRQKNRRVEIILQEKTDEQVREELREQSKQINQNTKLFDSVFDLDPDEIF